MFEYKIEHIKWMDINISLNEQGKSGWELIQVIPSDKDVLAFFKRKKD